MSWKYGLVKIDEEEGEDVCELFELYDTDGDGEFHSFCCPRLGSVEALRLALSSVEADGVNTWFWKNGRFRGYAWYPHACDVHPLCECVCHTSLVLHDRACCEPCRFCGEGVAVS